MDKNDLPLAKCTQLAFWLILVSGNFGLVGCHSNRSKQTELDVEKIKKEVQQRLDSFEQAERDQDVDVVLEHLTPEFYMYQDGKRTDYATIVQQLKTTLPTLQKFEPQFEDIEINVLCRDAVMVSMIFKDEITASDGSITRMWGPTTFIWKKTGGKWRISYADSDHYPQPDE